MPMGEPDRRKLIGQQLLALDGHSPNDKEQYRKEISTMLENQEKQIRLVKRINVLVYLFLIFVSVAFLTAMATHNFERKMEFGIIGLVVMIVASIVAIPMYVATVRFEMLKEFKELQLRIIELGEKISSKV
jgi:ABC-type transport system involved in cytochrome bd biosynthesis fused ATPase/permease subunit